ncbi:hypothetical protein [Acidipropionibacterium thoenii]|uniref:hypothetical protein n=1 Tax=Acidipropionibacterium thoenii TaxID=1751 RepID=UPI00042A292C|nr:hypothetical protein [Acidipropionibacterium thoenii]
MRPPVVITSRVGRIGTAVLGAAALALMVWDASRVGLLRTLVNLPFVALFVWCAWLFWGLASIRIDDAGIQVVNQLRIWNVPWARLESVTGRWGVTLSTAAQTGHDKGRSIRAWAAPAKGTAGKIASADREMPMIPEQGSAPVRVSLDAFSAARLIEIEQIQRRPTDQSSAAAVQARPNWATIGVTVILVVLAILA